MTQTSENIIRRAISEILDCPVREIDMDASFADLGIDSFFGLRLVGKLSDWIGEEVDPELFLDYPSPRLLAEYLNGMDIELPSDGSALQEQ